MKNLYGPDGTKISYYQVNATFFSALGEDEQKLRLSRAIQMFMPGIPQVWYLDLFAGKNNYEAADRGVVARIVTGPHDAHRQDSYLPMRYDTGRPRAVIRLRISQPRTTSLPCPAGLRARRPSPMMDLYRKNVFSTRP